MERWVDPECLKDKSIQCVWGKKKDWNRIQDELWVILIAASICCSCYKGSYQQVGAALLQALNHHFAFYDPFPACLDNRQLCSVKWWPVPFISKNYNIVYDIIL